VKQHFWATICKTVCPVLLDRRPVCDIGVWWPNGWMDQDETWHAGKPRPWPHCVRWGPSSPPPKGHSPPIFSPCLLWPNGWMDQDATWYRGRPRPRRYCVRWGPCSTQRGTAPPQFSAHIYCGQTAGWMKTPLGTEADLGPGHIVLDRDPAPPQKRHSSPSPSFRPMSIVATVAHLS